MIAPPMLCRGFGPEEALLFTLSDVQKFVGFPYSGIWILQAGHDTVLLQTG